METSRRQGLAPFVFFGNDMHVPDPALVSDRPAFRYAYVMWRQDDGVATVAHERELDGQQWQVRPGDIAVTEPGSQVQVGPKSRLRMIVFALTGGPFRVGSKGYILDNRTPRQPSWHALFGTDLVPRLEQDVAEAGAMLDFVSANYWRSESWRVEANARIHLWVARHARHLEQEQEVYIGDGSDLPGLAERMIEDDLRSASVASIADRRG